MKYLIHVEKLWDEKVWENLLGFIQTHKDKCHLFLMSPQINYQQAVLGYRGTKQELEKVLKQKYNELKHRKGIYNFKIGMHIHMCLHPKELPEIEKDKMFFNSYEFLKEIILDIDGITFGWFKYDPYLEGLCEKNHLQIIHSGISFHDYDLPLTSFKLFESWLRNKLRKIKNFVK